MENGSCEDEKSCYIWCDPDPKLVPEVMDSIKECRFCNKELPLLHLTANLDAALETPSLLGFVLHFCRKKKLLQNDFTSFLCSKDHQLAMQLCAARDNKKEKGEFSMDISNMSSCLSRYVAMCTEDSDHTDNMEHQVLQSYLDFLKFSNSIDEWQLISLFKKVCKDHSFKTFLHGYTILISGTPANLTSMKILELLTENRTLFKIQVEVPLDASFQDEANDTNINITTEEISLQHVSIVKPPFPHTSATEEYVREILITFLRLLVNSRDEMALAYALISPIIEMNHAAFTDLKRYSFDKGMPMYQSAISYVMQVKLGKTSYSPYKNHHLQQHLKGLSLLVDFLQHLQTILEDDPCPMSSFKKIVRTVKNRLLKKRCFRKESIENAAEGIIQLITSFHDKYREVGWHNLSLDDDEMLKVSSLKATKFLCWIVDCLSTQYQFGDLPDIFSNSDRQGTPLNLPTIFSYFKSPLECDDAQKQVGSNNHEEAAEVNLVESNNPGLIFNKKVFNVESSAEKNNPLMQQHQTPVLKNRTMVQQNIEYRSEKEPVTKKTKRCIFGELTNVPKKEASKTKKPARSKKAKDPPKGQINITQYFIPR